MTMATLITTVLILLILFLWLDGARAREIAIAIGTEICKHRDYQFLDGSVVRSRMGLRWTNSGIRIRRMFSFDYSTDGANRLPGYILLLGTQLETYQLTDEEDGDTSKVIPFRKRH